MPGGIFLLDPRVRVARATQTWKTLMFSTFSLPDTILFLEPLKWNKKYFSKHKGNPYLSQYDLKYLAVHEKSGIILKALYNKHMLTKILSQGKEPKVNFL